MKIGDFITFTPRGTEERRQGLYIGMDRVLTEREGVLEIDPSFTPIVVPDKNLFPSSLMWVQNWRNKYHDDPDLEPLDAPTQNTDLYRKIIGDELKKMIDDD